MTTEALIRSVARQFSSPTHPAEDLAQELRILQWRNPDAWLGGRALSLVTDQAQWTGHEPVRGHRDAFRCITFSLDHAEERSNAHLDLHDHHEEVRAAVRALPPRDREYVFRRFWLDEPAGRAEKNRWTAIKKRLREDLSELLDTA